VPDRAPGREGYLSGCSEAIRAQAQAQARALQAEGRLGAVLRARHPAPHAVRSDRALHGDVADLRQRRLRKAAPIDRVAFDATLHPVRHAPGMHTASFRSHGGKTQARHDIRIATVFRDMPVEFLRMIAARELARLREPDRGKAFHQLCLRMEPGCHQYEFDTRLCLTHLEATGERLWAPAVAAPDGAGAQPACHTRLRSNREQGAKPQTVP
jgi:predicted metal-dependent hydrolase